MIKFYMKLAGMAIAVSANYPETKLYCKDFLMETEPENVEMEVTVSEEDLKMEREFAEKAGLGNASDKYLELLVVHRHISDEMPRHRAVMFHGSAIAVDGEVYLFTAPSGTGKSTHTRLWRERFGERAFMVNDDKPFLRVREDGGIDVCGAPWNGKHRLGSNTILPLKGICILSQAKENKIERVPVGDGFQTLYTQTYRPMSDAQMLKETLNVISSMLELPLWHLECTISQEAVKLSYEAMSGKCMEEE